MCRETGTNRFYTELRCISVKVIVWLWKHSFFHRETRKHRLSHPLSLRNIRNVRTSFPTKSSSPAINITVSPSSSCTHLSNPFRKACVSKGSLLWQMRVTTMSWLSITTRERRLRMVVWLTEHYLTIHQLDGRTMFNILKMAIDCWTFELSTRSCAGPSLQYAPLQSTRSRFSRHPRVLII